MKTIKTLLFVWIGVSVLVSGNLFAQNDNDWWPSTDPSDIDPANPGYPTLYTITATSGNNGTINPSGHIRVEEGGVQEFEVQPAAGYKVEDVTRDGESVFSEMTDNIYTFTNTSDNHTIHVTFESRGQGYHSADYGAGNHPDESGDYEISLSELLRVQQLYSRGSYHCDAEGEDGYALGDGDHTCSPHDSDYNPQNWIIELGEFLRLIQFYNVGGYEAAESGEDGFVTVSE